MNLTVLKTLGGPRVQRAALKISKYAPEILTGIGIVGVVTSTVMIAKATTKLEPVTEDYQTRRSDIKIMRDTDEDYAENSYSRDLTKTYLQESVALIKLYGPGVSLNLASIISILAAHGIMQRRSVALIGAYKAVESAFSSYRQRVIEEFGEDKDLDFRTGFRTETIEDPETGKKKKVKTLDPNAVSTYARFFDENSKNWSEQPEYNLMFLKNQQNFANDLLRARGHLFLNEVYDMLGVDRSQAGQAVGWAVTQNGGDNYVDFNIYNTENANFVNGYEKSILLDFNVDGVIIDLI